MRLIAAISAVIVLSCAQLALATNPSFGHINPLGGQRGTEVEVTLFGNNLLNAEELMLYDSGMEVLSFEPVASEDEKVNGKRVKVRLKIAADCPVGSQRMRIRTRTGLSDLRNFHVGTFPVVREVEPNTVFESPQAIEMNSTVQGRIDKEDVDYFVVEAKKGDRISAEIFGQRLGRSSGPSYFDPYISILNMERFDLAANDDTALLNNDSMVSVIAPEDGKYVVQVRDASYNGDGQAHYLLHVGNFPRPKSVYPAGGQAGQSIEVTFRGDVSGPMTRQVQIPEKSPIDGFKIEVSDELGTAPSAHPFRISNFPNILEQEPNNSLAEANVGQFPVAFNGVISEKNDIDFFEFSGKQGQVVSIEVYARRIRSGLDPIMSLHLKKDGRMLASDDDSQGVDCAIKTTLPEDGEYVIAVRDHLNNGDENFFYRIEVDHVQPNLVVSPLEFARYVQHQIVIPQGGGGGMVANIQRMDMAGLVNIKSDQLPPGVRIEFPESWRADATSSVVFYADEDAPIGGTFVPLTAFVDDPGQPDAVIEGPVFQNVLMIRANNDDRIWQERMNRLPIIVVEKPDFKCWIETPAVPIVQNGSLNLVVKCEKFNGWDEDIALQFLQNPPGVSSSGSGRIAKGETSGVISVNAANNAPIRETMIAVRCTAPHAGGTYEVVTPFAPLRVEQPYATLEFAQGAMEQGAELNYAVTVVHREPFEGDATATLLGLPAFTTVEPVTFNKDTAELHFIVKTTPEAPVGMNQNLFCQVNIPEAGAVIIHNLGTGRLRIDKPAPPKMEAENAPVEEAAPVVAQTEAPAKPLSRLEQLRLEQKQKNK